MTSDTGIGDGDGLGGADEQDVKRAVERFEAAGQGHVFRFLGSLEPHRARALLDQSATIDLDEVAGLATPATDAAATTIAPPGDELIALADDPDGGRHREARDAGIALLQSGAVAVVIVAGGQGTRLGSDRPKALFPVGPVTRRSLLAWHAAKVRHWSIKLGRPVPLILMLSDATDAPTRRFLDDYQCFGLDPAHVHTVVQGSLPALDDDGKLILASTSGIALAPNGHGGLYRALADGGLAERLAKDGITTLSYVQIDNPLIQPVDPVFLGHHARASSQISSKSVMKTAPAEKVGVFGHVDGRPAVIEYSELTDEQAALRDDSGALRYGHGSIAAHVIDLEFARAMAARGLPLHRARKKVPHVDESGATVTPAAPNATKFETFLFDAIPVADRCLVVETRREDEFSPIKNAAGTDSAETAAAHLQDQFRRWYENAGLAVPDGPIEVDPEEAPDEAAFREHKGLPADR